jgi:hypothetical protein
MTIDEGAEAGELPDVDALEAQLAALEAREAALRGEVVMLSRRLAVQRQVNAPHIARYSTFDLAVFGLVASLPIGGTIWVVLWASRW